jgi:hypothetical protein
MENQLVRGLLFRASISLTSFLLLGLTITNAQNASTNNAKTAETQSYRAGTKSLVIPPPSSEFVEIGSDYRVILEGLTPETNRLIAAFLLPAEIPLVESGSDKPMTRYVLVEIPRKVEFADVNPDIFKQITDALGQQFGGNLDASLNGQMDEVNRRLKALGTASSTINIDKPVQLGILFSTTDAYSYGMIIPVTANGVTTKMAMELIALRIKNRVIFAYIYAQYKHEGTVQWLRKTGEDWADAILKANKS